MRTMTPEFVAAIPPEIRSLVLVRDVLPGEDANSYDSLLVALKNLLVPKDVLQWLDLKHLQDLIWRQARLSRITPGIIQSAQKKALSSLLLSMTNESVCDFTPDGNVTRAEEQALAWFTDPAAKKELQELLSKFNYSQDTIDAMAFVERAEVLATIDKMQMSNVAQQFALRQRFEERPEVLQLQHDASKDDEQEARQLPPPADNDVVAGRGDGSRREGRRTG